jgi:hypothetical protein
MLTDGHGNLDAPRPYPRPWKLRCVVARACASERKRARDRQPNPHQTHASNLKPNHQTHIGNPTHTKPMFATQIQHFWEHFLMMP